MKQFSILYRVVAALCVCSLLSNSVRCGDWPQVLGPFRTGVAEGERLSVWPDSGPRVIWETDVQQGFAGVAVLDGVVFLFHADKSSEIVEARSARNGAEIWKVSFPCRFQSGYSSDNGPRCVPLVTRDRVFVFGVKGVLRALDRETGKEIWNRDTWKDFSAPAGFFGAGSSPILVGDRLIVNVGGRDDGAAVAFAAADGKTLWHSFDDRASYSSPIAVKRNGRTHVLMVTRFHTLSIDPADGAIRFQFPFGARGPTVNAASPVVMGQHLFVTASYRVGSVLAEFDDNSVRPESSGEKLLATQYATPIADETVLYAVDGRQDGGAGSATLKCFDPFRQQILWQQDGFDYGTLLRVGDEFLFLTCGGELIRFDVARDAYRERARCRVLKPTPGGYRLPALSAGRLFVRDDNQLRCLEVGESVSADD